MELNEFFAAHPEVAVAFSGGVDSAYLLYAAKRAAKRVKAYYACSAFQPQFELEDAKRLAAELDVQMQIIPLDVLADAQVAENPKNRCYYCKKRIFGAITAQALRDGFSVLLDGTNASDDADDRPGMRALEELSVLSPLRLCGLTKAQIRALSKEAGLFTWDRPTPALPRASRQGRSSRRRLCAGRKRRRAISSPSASRIFACAPLEIRRSFSFARSSFRCCWRTGRRS